MEIKRDAYQDLLRWKSSADRKPLLIRGARQVGKTTLVRQFSREFRVFVELSMERKDDRSIFQRSYGAEELLNVIFLERRAIQQEGETLIFIDEIQESPEAVMMLRHLYEDRPDLHVIAAGSLLEFALAKVPSFPVGRIDYLTLHPVSFPEYLQAVNPGARNILQEMPVPGYAGESLLKLFHEYAIVGGMPGILSRYLDHRDLAALQKAYRSLWQSFRDDAEKYAGNDTQRKVIRHVIETAPGMPDRIKFEGFGNSSYRSREVGEALRALDMARVIRLIYPTTNMEPPALPNLKKRPRLQFVDTGLLNQVLMVQAGMIGIPDLNQVYKGRIIQHLLYQEITSIHPEPDYKPRFWVREERNSQAEVDLVYPFSQYLIPLEVKSGKQGKLRSLHQFVEKSRHPFAVRFYRGPYSVEKVRTPGGHPYLLMNLPYFLGTRLELYLHHLIQEYPV